MSEKNKPLILLVDDTPENIDVLIGMLEGQYGLSVAADGKSALKLAAQNLPDLILLDVMMPEINGYEVCRRLKSDPATEHIPVIFLTALTTDSHEQEGLELGAVDYISKPFNPSLVNVRIANHLALEKARQDLKRYGEKLEELVAERTQQLEEAHEQLKAIDETKNDFLSAISHELRTPANGMFGVGSLAIESLPEGEEKTELKTCFEESSQRLVDMLDGAMHLAELQSGEASLQPESIEMEELVKSAATAVKEKLPDANLSVSDNQWFECRAKADRSFLQQSLETLLTAAVKLNSCETPVHINGECLEEHVMLKISSCGQTVSEELTKTMFEPFSPERSASLVEELGFRLPVAAKMIRAMNGKVSIQNVAGAGFTIQVDLPLA